MKAQEFITQINELIERIEDYRYMYVKLENDYLVFANRVRLSRTEKFLEFVDKLDEVGPGVLSIAVDDFEKKEVTIFQNDPSITLEIKEANNG